MPSAAASREFLAQRRIALVGVSRDPNQFANSVWKELRNRGYEVVPINPHATVLDGVTVYPSLQSVPGGVDGAMLFLPPDALPKAVDDCLAARVPRVWFRSTGGRGASPDLVKRAGEAGARVIDGGCPYMFLEGAGWFHNLHATIVRLCGGLQP